MSLELFCRYWNPHQVEEVNCRLPTSMYIPDQLEPEDWWCWLLISSPPTNQKNVHKLNMPCFLNTVRLLSTPSRVGHTVLRALAPFAWQSNKAILFNFTQNSVSAFLFSTGEQRLSFGITWHSLSLLLTHYTLIYVVNLLPISPNWNETILVYELLSVLFSVGYPGQEHIIC